MSAGAQPPEPPSPDLLAELVQQVANAKSREAFLALFDHFAPRLKAFYRRRGADEARAEDLVQDVMVALWQRAEQFDHRQAGVSTWLFTIARNRQIDLIRRDLRPDLDPDEPALQPSDPPAPDVAFDMTQVATRVRAALEQLPPEQAELIRLSFYEEASHSAIAQHLELPLGTVKSRLRLALQKLRLALGEGEPRA